MQSVVVAGTVYALVGLALNPHLLLGTGSEPIADIALYLYL
jgi:hypothetical protein